MPVALDNVLVSVPGLPDGSRVSVEVSVDGLKIRGFGTLPWAGAHVDVEDRAPKGVRIESTAPGGVPSAFFVPCDSVPAGTRLGDFETWLQETVTGGGGVLVERLSVTSLGA
jgi:hypothetical protein